MFIYVAEISCQPFKFKFPVDHVLLHFLLSTTYSLLSVSLLSLSLSVFCSLQQWDRMQIIQLNRQKTAEKIVMKFAKRWKRLSMCSRRQAKKKPRWESIQQSINVNERKTFRHVHSKQEQKKQNNRFSDYNRNLSIIYICACIFIMYSLHGCVELLVSCVPCTFRSSHRGYVAYLAFCFYLHIHFNAHSKRNIKARAQKKTY